MSDDHLPECERWFTDMPEPDECPACEMFRACEKRVVDEALMAEYLRYDEAAIRDQDAAYRKGYDAGLDAAREAVTALPRWPLHGKQ